MQALAAVVEAATGMAMVAAVVAMAADVAATAMVVETAAAMAEGADQSPLLIADVTA
jgi:hypothetical protein